MYKYIRNGAVVKVREDLEPRRYGENTAVYDMMKYRGRLAIVYNLHGNKHHLQLEGIPWNWTPEMLVIPNNDEIEAYLKGSGSQ